jgi:16S rRNA (guanine527-N7)-methyltransferase
VANSFQELIRNVLPEYGLSLDTATVERLAAYLDLLTRWNERIRLVGSTEPAVLVRNHLAESLYLGRLITLSEQAVIDVGSGAGFPGVALQLAWPKLKTTYVEANAKKATFLKEVVRQTGLGRVITARAEDVKEQADIVTARALERMELGPSWAEHLVVPNGMLACWISIDFARDWARRSTGWQWQEPVILPGTHSRSIALARHA